jgi:hypothetical protein
MRVHISQRNLKKSFLTADVAAILMGVISTQLVMFHMAMVMMLVATAVVAMLTTGVSHGCIVMTLYIVSIMLMIMMMALICVSMMTRTCLLVINTLMNMIMIMMVMVIFMAMRM